MRTASEALLSDSNRNAGKTNWLLGATTEFMTYVGWFKHREFLAVSLTRPSFLSLAT